MANERQKEDGFCGGNEEAKEGIGTGNKTKIVISHGWGEDGLPPRIQKSKPYFVGDPGLGK